MMNVRDLGRLVLASVLVVGCAPKTTAGDGDDSSTETGSSTGDPTTSDGCEDLLDDGEFSCSGTGTEGCAFLAEHPDRVASWDLSFHQDLGDTGEPEDTISDFERKAACVAAYLDGIGVEHDPIEHDSLELAASYAQVEPLCRASMIDGCTPYAIMGDCEPLDEDECPEDPLCFAVRGPRIEPGADCQIKDVFALCVVGWNCSDAGAVYQGPDGACWELPACFSGYDGWTKPAPDCPDAWGAIPECG